MSSFTSKYLCMHAHVDMCTRFIVYRLLQNTFSVADIMAYQPA